MCTNELLLYCNNRLFAGENPVFMFIFTLYFVTL